MQEYLVGIDIGGTTIKLGLFPTDGDKYIEAWEIKTKTFDEVQYIWSDIAEAVFKKMEELGIEKSQLKAAGMGLPGPIREDGFLPRCVNLGMGSCYPGKELSSYLGVPVAAGNDANVAALGEVYYGAAKGFEDAALFTLGTGVGGGIVVKGKLVAGNRGVGGEVGHFVVNPEETVPCNCGNKGCLEQYASATGIVRSAKKLLASSKVESTLRSFEDLSCKDICDEAKKGDPIAMEALDIYGKYLGMAISYVVLTNDPDVIVLGGGVSKAGQILIDAVAKYVDMNTHIAEKRGDIVLATLGNDGGIYGAAALAKTQL